MLADLQRRNLFYFTYLLLLVNEPTGLPLFFLESSTDGSAFAEDGLEQKVKLDCPLPLLAGDEGLSSFSTVLLTKVMEAPSELTMLVLFPEAALNRFIAVMGLTLRLSRASSFLVMLLMTLLSVLNLAPLLELIGVLSMSDGSSFSAGVMADWARDFSLFLISGGDLRDMVSWDGLQEEKFVVESHIFALKKL